MKNSEVMEDLQDRPLQTLTPVYMAYFVDALMYTTCQPCDYFLPPATETYPCGDTPTPESSFLKFEESDDLILFDGDLSPILIENGTN